MALLTLVFDWFSALIAIAASIALLRYRANVIHLIAACAIAGLLLKSLPG
jgi:chromate transporter